LVLQCTFKLWNNNRWIVDWTQVQRLDD